MGISRDSKHKRRNTGGKRKIHRKKRKYELGRPSAMTRLGTKRIHLVRCRGGMIKHRALKLDHGNFSWSSEAVAKKTRILVVVYNASNNELVRTNTLVKNSIVQVDATPFKSFYEQHYGVVLGKQKSAGAKAAQAATSVARSESASASAAKNEQRKEGAAAAASASGASKSGEKKEKKEKAPKKDAAPKTEQKKETAKTEQKKDGAAGTTPAAKSGDKKDKKDKKSKKSAKAAADKKDSASKDGKKSESDEKAADATPAKKSSRTLQNLKKRSNAHPPLDTLLTDQFSSGRLYACIASRPGQSGRCDGYILEGEELAFYLRKLKK